MTMSKKDVLKGRSIVAHTPAVGDNQEPEIISTLSDIQNYYQKRLSSNLTGREILKSFGIENPLNIERFKFGFSDGTLINVLSENQKNELKTIEILQNDNTETFAGMVTIPLLNESGLIKNLVGLDNNGNCKYLITPAQQFNIKASKVYDEIIFTDKIISALSLIEAGCDNVIGVEGVDNLDAHDLIILKDNRVKTVVLAFQKKDSVEIFKSILKDLGYNVKEIYPPFKANWNDELKLGLTAEVIKKLIGEAELVKAVKDDDSDTVGVKVHRDGGIYLFTMAEIIYKVTGVNEIFVTDLKVNIKAEYQERKFPDKVDLYSSRSRSSFGFNLSKEFNIEPKRVEKDLLTILDYLEAERDKRLSAGAKDEVPELTEDERKLGLSFLKSADLFGEITRDLETLGYIGEDLNKQLIYLCASSRKLADPISVLILSQSASGKSMLVDTVKKLIPADEVLSITSLSDQALNYIDNLSHKFLVFGEAVHNEVIEHQIREMLSSKELSRLVTLKDEKTGKLQSRIVKKEVIVSSVLSSTTNAVNPENASRYFIVNTDESKEQTRRIHEAQRVKYSLARYKEKSDVIPAIIKKHHTAQRLLTAVNIVNPFAVFLNFPDSQMRTRRDHDRFIDLIACVCFLRQYQKEYRNNGNFQYIECDLEDYGIAYNIMVNGVLASTMVEIPKGAMEIYETIREMVGVSAKKNNLKVNETSFTQRDLREFSGFGHTWIKQNLRILLDFEYINIVKGGNSRSKGFYKLREDEEIKALNLSIIPNPDEIKLKLDSLDTTGHCPV